MTTPTPISSSPARKPTITVEPYPDPLHHYLSKAIAGHHQIVAAIANHAEDHAERAEAIGQLHAGP